MTEKNCSDRPPHWWMFIDTMNYMCHGCADFNQQTCSLWHEQIIEIVFCLDVIN